MIKRLMTMIMGLMMLTAALAMAATIHVPADQPTIQAGINAAMDGDTVLVAPGVYVGSGNRDVVFNGKAMKLVAEKGSDSTVIDCEQQGRAFRLNQSGETNATLIQGFTITRGSSLSPIDEGKGGAVYLYDSSPTFKNCVFYRNAAENYGGAVYVRSSVPNPPSAATFLDCEFSENNRLPSDARGGAIACGSWSYTVVRDCRFTHNMGSQYGGAIVSLESGRIQVDSCVFDGNSVWNGGLGGALSISNGSTVSASFFRDNSSDLSGGALHGGGSLIRNCTFSHNSAASSGAAVQSTGLDISNCLIVFSKSGAAIAGNAQLMCCDLYGNAGGDWVGAISGQATQNGNFSADPAFCDTMNQVFSLHNSSPCLPSGNSCDSLIGALGLGCSTVIENVNLGQNDNPGNLVSHFPTIYWAIRDSLSSPQVSYEIEVTTDSTWSIADTWNTGIVESSDTSAVYGGLLLIDGETYWLRVRWSDSRYWSEWGGLKFRMNSIPTVPQLRLPIGEEIVPSQQPSLTIHNSTDAEYDSLSYTYEVSPDNFAATIFTFTKKQDADSLTTLIVDSTLVENTQYWWRVKASDYYEESDYSPTWSFYVNSANTAPTAVSLTQPVNTIIAPVTILRPQFVWTSASDPDPLDSITYDLVIAIDSNFVFVQQIPNLTATNHTLAGDLLWGTRYWWKVKSLDRYDAFNWSPAFTFRTMTLGDANNDGTTNISDAVYLIAYIFSGGLPPNPLILGDANCDGAVNISDAVYLIAYIFAGGLAPCSEF